MTGPVDARLVELNRRTNSWPFVFFALLSGWCRGDLDFLVAKKFGHTGGRTVAALYPSDVARLRAAARRIGHSDASFNNLLGGVIPLAIAHFGVPPSALRVEDLEALVAFAECSPRLTAAMRRGRHSQLFRLRQLLFQANMTEDPPPRRREGGPATRAQRLSAVPSAGVRHSILAYLEARSAVVRPKTLDKLTSALAIFGEFIGEHFPELDSLSALERHHVEAFLRGPRPASAGDPRMALARSAPSFRPMPPSPCATSWTTSRRGVGLKPLRAGSCSRPTSLANPRSCPGASHQTSTEPSWLRSTNWMTSLPRSASLCSGTPGCGWASSSTSKSTASWTLARVAHGCGCPSASSTTSGPSLSTVPRSRPSRSGWPRTRPQRALPHQRDGRLRDFVFVEHGRRLGPTRIQRGLSRAVEAAGLPGPDGMPRRVVAHQLRHTWATELVNAGMSLQALMALLGHRTPEMTIRYAAPVVSHVASRL